MAERTVLCNALPCAWMVRENERDGWDFVRLRRAAEDLVGRGFEVIPLYAISASQEDEKVDAAREFVKRHPALTLIDLAEFEAFIKVPAAFDAAFIAATKAGG